MTTYDVDHVIVLSDSHLGTYFKAAFTLRYCGMKEICHRFLAIADNLIANNLVCFVFLPLLVYCY